MRSSPLLTLRKSVAAGFRSPVVLMFTLGKCEDHFHTLLACPLARDSTRNFADIPLSKYTDIFQIYRLPFKQIYEIPVIESAATCLNNPVWAKALIHKHAAMFPLSRRIYDKARKIYDCGTRERSCGLPSVLEIKLRGVYEGKKTSPTFFRDCVGKTSSRGNVISCIDKSNINSN